MNKPRLPGDDNRSGDESISAKWSDLVNAMRQSDPLVQQATDSSAQSPVNGQEALATMENVSTDTAPEPASPYSLYSEEASDEVASHARAPLLIAAAFLIVAIVWVAFAAWTLVPGLAPAGSAGLLFIVSTVAMPILLLFALWVVLSRRREDPLMRWTDYAQAVGDRADRSLEYLAEGERRIAHAYETLDRLSRSASALAEGSSEALLATSRRIESQSDSAQARLRQAGAVASEALTLIDAIDRRMPDLEGSLSHLSATLSASTDDLTRQGATLEEQLRGAAMVAEEVRLQLTQGHDASVRQMGSLRDASRATGDELTAMADLASARVEFVLERARSAMSAARDGLQEHMDALSELGDQGDRSMANVRGLSDTVDAIGTRLSVLEQDVDGGQARIAGHLSALGAQAERVGGALQASNQGAAHLIERVETLLLALDSNIREIDESLPAALGRFDARLLTTEAKLTEAAALAEGMAGTADAAARHLEQASDTLIAQSRAVESSISAGDSSLARQTAELSVMRAALDESASAMAHIVETRAPQLVRTMATVRAEAAQATHDTEEAINAIVSRAAAALSEASGNALDAAINDKVNDQIARIAQIADNAVKAAHRATDHLMREMMAITDTATDLEARMAKARQIEQDRGRDHIADRSAQIIAALNDSA
ncbi:MAG: hypothetical protein ABW192_01980, partial [Sphingobium sp.]